MPCRAPKFQFSLKPKARKRSQPSLLKKQKQRLNACTEGRLPSLKKLRHSETAFSGLSAAHLPRTSRPWSRRGSAKPLKSAVLVVPSKGLATNPGFSMRRKRRACEGTELPGRASRAALSKGHVKRSGATKPSQGSRTLTLTKVNYQIVTVMKMTRVKVMRKIPGIIKALTRTISFKRSGSQFTIHLVSISVSSWIRTTTSQCHCIVKEQLCKESLRSKRRNWKEAIVSKLIRANRTALAISIVVSRIQATVLISLKWNSLAQVRWLMTPWWGLGRFKCLAELLCSRRSRDT